MSYNLSNLFLEAFGLEVKKAYVPDFDNKSKGLQVQYSGIEMIDEEEAVAVSSLGTPIIYPITFLGKQYKTITNEGKIELKSMPEFRLPASCIIHFDREKVIQETKINNGNGGTVKEIFGFNSFQITIRGFCVQDDQQPQGHTTAIAQEEHLQQWEQIVDRIEVRGKLFNIRDITGLVIRKIPFTALRGKPGIKPFVIHALSDESLDLILQ